MQVSFNGYLVVSNPYMRKSNPHPMAEGNEAYEKYISESNTFVERPEENLFQKFKKQLDKVAGKELEAYALKEGKRKPKFVGNSMYIEDPGQAALKRVVAFLIENNIGFSHSEQNFEEGFINGLSRSGNYIKFANGTYLDVIV